jgi:sterol desaturase/sphingolipid hydroxylase (fatty acid hydroxylase superfamily)
MPTKSLSLTRIAGFLIVPLVFAGFYALRIATQGHPIDRWLPKWYTLLAIACMVLLERMFAYRYAVSQRPVLTRDILSSLVNIYLSAAVTGMILLPILAPIPEYLLGRKTVVALAADLGPIWLQVPALLLLISFFRYWMHRWQHANEFLWKLHSYHHGVTDLKGSNTYVSHPLDWALRNAVVFVLLGLIGFDPQAMLIAVPATVVSGLFSHCGADVKGGALNYLFVTPEVHRWHHTAAVPEGYGYSVNYGVEFSFWDILFGTFYLPQKDGQVGQPERLGHPGGMADEGNYLRLLLKPLGLWRPLPAFLRSQDRRSAQ